MNAVSFKAYWKSIALLSSMVAASVGVVSCGGGGGDVVVGSSVVLYYPYETLYGDICTTFEATPGCTFFSSNGARITVTEDPHYNRFGGGSNDMGWVDFDATGTWGTEYNSAGVLLGTYHISTFSNYVAPGYIGLGTTGLFWENVSGGTYWVGKNDVLYNANLGETNYGKAINDKTAGDAVDTNLAALNSEANSALVKKGEDKLVAEYGFSREKAHVVATALNRWGVASAERGFTTVKDMDVTFKGAFGVNFSAALAAANQLKDGDPSAMIDLTNRSSEALGLKPDQAAKFAKGMYQKALANWGYDVSSFGW